MRTIKTTIIFALAFCSIPNSNVFALDTLKVAHECASPISNPTTIEWDGNSFWTSNLKTPYVYKLDSDMKITDSIDCSHSRIAAIAFQSTELWIAIDSSVSDTLVQNSTYKVYSIYRLDPQTGTIKDSIFFRSVAVNVSDTGYVCGLAIHNDSIYVTLNSGWSSGLYVIDLENQTTKLIDYLPLSGISLIENENWGIRRTGGNSEGKYITNLLRKDLTPFVLTFNATDISSDGTSVMICNMRDSKFIQSQIDASNVNRTSLPYQSINSNGHCCVKISMKGNICGSGRNSSLINIKGQRFSSQLHSASNISIENSR